MKPGPNLFARRRSRIAKFHRVAANPLATRIGDWMEALRLPLPWQASDVPGARGTPQVPLRIALRQTVSASTPHDVPLP
jgi:hypothetical protein